MYNLSGLRTALTVLLVIMAVFIVISMMALFYRATLFDDLAEGTFVSADTADGADALVALPGGMRALLGIATAVVFIIWQYRHAVNARALGARGSLGPGWAIGGWFIPFANLLLPAMQLFGASRSSDVQVDRRIAGAGRGAGVVVAWAIMFGVYVVTSGMAGVAAQDDEGLGVDVLSQSATADRMLGASGLFGAAAAVLAIVMVRSLSQRQAQALSAHATGMGGPQAPWGAPHSPWGAAPPGGHWGGQPHGPWNGPPAPDRPAYGTPEPTGGAGPNPMRPTTDPAAHPPQVPDPEDERPSGPPAPPAPPPPPA